MTMKKFIYLTLIALYSIIVSGCGKATQQPIEATPNISDQMINPGEKIGDFLITTGEGEDVVFVSKLHCPYDTSTGIESCEQPIGTKVNVGEGIYDDNPTSGKTLDEYWSEQTHEMFIEGHPINLQAFGTIDFNNPAVGTVRVWNVVIVTDKPGKITAHSAGVVGGDPFDYTAALTFTAP
jgi:hypothetical protein